MEYPAAILNLMDAALVDKADDATVASAVVQVVDGSPSLSVQILPVIVNDGSVLVRNRLTVNDFKVYADPDVNDPDTYSISFASSLPSDKLPLDSVFESGDEQPELFAPHTA